MDANNRMIEQRDRIVKKQEARLEALEENGEKKVEDDVVTMDGASMYSRVGYNLKKPKNFNKNKAFPHRKSSILDDFEAIANESHEEMMNRGSQLKQSVEISPRK